ncbi:MAG: HU family DNA-binding protein [Sphaerochaeta sp.]|jgi:nucleoid DNA-binding protein
MTEKELYTALAGKVEITQDKSREIIEALVEIITTNDKVVIGKIGTFEMAKVKATPARTGVKNPLTGGTYDIPAKPERKKLKFTLSKSGKTIGA